MTAPVPAQATAKVTSKFTIAVGSFACLVVLWFNFGPGGCDGGVEEFDVTAQEVAVDAADAPEVEAEGSGSEGSGDADSVQVSGEGTDVATVGDAGDLEP